MENHGMPLPGLARKTVLLIVLSLLAAAGRAATLPSGFTETSVGGLSSPTAMAVSPDGRIFVCEQGGKLRVIKNNALLSTPFVTLTVDSNGERGLLGVALDPNFTTNNYLYVYYTVPGSPAHNRASRFTANGDVAAAGSELQLLNLNNLSSATNHNGGAMHFGLDGKLYIAVGENANGSNAQTLANLLGKILRINSDGSIPDDNPFVDNPSARHEIWTYGHRNPFSFGVQPFTGRIFVNDVGEVTWEEIDDEMAGLNYGWPICEGPFQTGSSTPCGHPEFTDPISYYPHSGNPQACAITGGDFYDPQTPQFPAEYVGNYFFSDYCGNFIKRLDPDTGTVTPFATGASAPVDIDVDDYGNLYYLARGSNAVFKVIYTGSNAPVITQDPLSQLISTGHPVTFTVAASGAAPLAYQWQRDSVDLPGENGSSYAIASVGAGDDGHQFRCVVSNAFPPPATSAQATLTVTSNQPPTATITAPTIGTTYKGGDTIIYSGSGTDPEDGTLPPSSMTWWVNFHHNTHFHPFIPPTTGSAGGSFVIPVRGETSPNVWYRIHLLVVDSIGLTNEVYRDVIPQTSTMTFATDPSGLQVTLDGQPLTAPQDVIGVVNMIRSLGAPSPQGIYAFVSWSDGGAQTHEISTPASNTTFTALFTGPAPTPSVSGIEPTSGPPAGGTASTLTGANFVSGATVKIGGIAATGVGFVDAQHLTASTPALPAGSLNDVVVTNPSDLFGTLVKGWFADFLDVPQSNLFHADVETIFRNGITAGCGAGNYCPALPVTRAQMAVFLLKGEHGGGYTPPTCSATIFGDVPCPGGPNVNWVNRLFEEGITSGCGNGNYCPSDPLTRAQMAVFLLKGKHGGAYGPPACAATEFADVPCPGAPFVDWINQLWAEGITAGCGGGNYCPAAATPRAQMATFLVRTFSLP
jgi:glucose/arabinose dehydrogenase